MRRLLGRIWRFVKARYSEWRSALFVALLFLILWGLFRPEMTSPQIKIQTTEVTSTEVQTATTEEPPAIRSYITGAVERPGVYSLPQGSILQDLVEVAGGFMQGAQVDTVNLAMEITDQAHYHIPDPEDDIRLSPPQGLVQGDDSHSHLVQLNTAGLEDLQRLNGIGPSLAQRILEWRESYGPFKTKDELMLVPGIKEAKYNALEHQLATIQ